MAIISLPNGSEYDTALPWTEQPDSGSYMFINEVVESNIPIDIKEQTRNSKLQRILSQTWIEKSYPEFDYIYKTSYNYKFGSGDSRCFAILGTINEFKIESK